LSVANLGDLKKQIPHETVNCLTILDWQRPLPANDAFELALRLFNSMNAEPSIWLGTYGANQSRMSSRRAFQKVIQQQPELCFDFVLRREREDFAGVWDISCMYYDASNANEPTKGLSCFQFAFNEKLAGFNRAMFDQIAKSIADKAGFQYGYAVQAPYGVIGEEYGIGLAATLPIDSELEDAYAWPRTLSIDMRLKQNRPFTRGLLRFVYPLNYLSRRQIDHPVGDKSLKEWIESAADRGNLTWLCDELFVWQVPEEQIRAIRVALGESGLLVAYKAPSMKQPDKKRLP
jgi:hypothetical protein